MSKKFLSPIKLAQGASNPASGSAGEIFYNTTDKAIYTHDGTGWGVAESSIPAGTMVQWGGSTAPTNWLLCDGTAVSRTTYATLFAAIGTSYGVGDGSTTFNLPDLRGRVPVGKNGGSFGTLGATGGAETVTLTSTQIPSHTHNYSGTTNTTGAHTHTLSGKINVSQNGYGQNSPINGNAGNFADGTALSAGDHSHTFSGTTDNGTGGNGSHNNLQPYQVVNYIIKTTSGTTAGDSPLTARVSAIETTTVRSIALGGTGASTASSALSNLGGAPLASPSFTGTTTDAALSVTAGSEFSTNAAAITRINMPSNASIATAGEVNTLQIKQPSSTGDAFLTFHTSGGWAAHLGIDKSINDLSYGGWSHGANKYRVYHAGNTVAIAYGGPGSTTGSGIISIGSTSVAVGSGSYSTSSKGLVTFTGASTIDLNGVFTTGYRNYLIKISGLSNVGDYLAFRMMSNGAQDSQAQYYTVGTYISGGTTANAGAQPADSYSRIGYFSTTYQNATYDVNIFNPKVSDQTTWNVIGGYSNVAYWYRGLHNTTTSFDGVRILPQNSGNFTGRMQVFAYAE